MKHGDKIKDKILEAALGLWCSDPKKMTTRNIAEKINMTHGTVVYHFGDTLRDSVAEHAVKRGESRIIVQLMALDHPAIQALTKRERAWHSAQVRG